MKIIVLGHARHGKDTVCNILHSNFNLAFVSSSYFAMDRAVIPYLAAKGITYLSRDDCYADRINHRADWFNAISAYNLNDPARLGKELFSQYDIYCGLRSHREFEALKLERAFFCAIWVDRSKIVEQESVTSNTISRTDADYIINNNGSLAELEVEVKRAMAVVQQHYHFAHS